MKRNTLVFVHAQPCRGLVRIVVACGLAAWPGVTVQAVAPPSRNVDMPAHVRAAQEEISRSYGSNGMAARLRQNKAEAEQRAAAGAAPAAQVMTQGIPIIVGNYADVSHIFSPAQLSGNLFASVPGTPPGNMRTYFNEVSGGQYQVSGSGYGPYTAPQVQSYYVNGDNGFGTDFPTNAGGFVRDLVQIADTLSTPPFGIAWGNYDNDGPDGVPNSGDDDGVVDGIIVIFPDGDASDGDANNIWAQQWNLSSSTGSSFVTNDARFGGGFIEVNEYVVIAAEKGDGTLNVIKPVGTYCHEWGHVLGLPDLYDLDGSSWGVGTWCLMGYGNWGVNWNNTTENSPVHMSAWCRAQLGWATPTVVTTLDSVGLLPGGVYKLWEDAYQGGRYFLVEYRDTTGFDAQLPSEGYLIWHCNEEVFYDNSVDNYRVVDLEEADGLGEIDSKTDWMDQGDMYPWGGTSFNDGSNPNSRDVFGALTGVGVNGYAMGPGKTIWIEMIPRTLSGFTLYYVGHTWLSGWGFAMAQDDYGAVRFVTPQAGDLVAVQAGVFAETPVNYQVRIFDDIVSGSPVGLHSTTFGTFPSFPNDRYHEVSLSATHAVSANDTFVVDVRWGPDDYAVPTLYRRPHSGQSYFSDNGAASSYSNWTDKDVAIRARLDFASAVCPVSSTGDVNTDSSITSSDIIYLVNFVFKGGPAPLPCQAAGDVNCDGSVTSSDIIYLVNFVFKGGSAPCDVCGLISAGTWTCP